MKLHCLLSKSIRGIFWLFPHFINAYTYIYVCKNQDCIQGFGHALKVTNFLYNAHNDLFAKASVAMVTKTKDRIMENFSNFKVILKEIAADLSY